MAGNTFDEYDTPAVAPAVAAAPPSTITDTILAIPGKAIDMESSLAAGIGRGVGNTALTAQDWIGKGLSLIGGGDIGGDWLQRNAQEGQAKLNAEFAPYQQRDPYSAGAGKIVGEVIGTGPVLKGVAGVAGAAKMPNVAAAIRSGGMEARNAFMRAGGGAVAGATTSALTSPEDTGLGALVGAVIPTAVAPVVSKIAKKAAEKMVPATEELFSKAKKLYQDMDASGVRIVQPAAQWLSQQMHNYVPSIQQYQNVSHSAVNTALKQLNEFASEPLSITRLNQYYKDLRDAASKIGGGEGSVLSEMANNVKGFMDKITPQILGGASTRDITNLRAANDLMHRAFKSQEIDDILRSATRKGEGEANAVSTATAIRRGFEKLADNKAKMATYTPEEQALIEKVAKGGYGSKILNMVSKLSPGAALSSRALVYGLIGAKTGVLPAVALGGAEATAKAWRNAMVKNQGKNVSMLIRNKGPVAAPPVRFPYPITQAGVSGAQQAKSKR